MQNKSLKVLIFIIIILLLAIMFLLVTKFTADKTYETRVASETSTELDVYKMHKYADENANSVLQAMREGNANDLSALMSEDVEVDSLLEYANWSEMDLDKSNSFGIGSLSKEADKNGRIDIGMQIVIKIGNEKYALYIQTVASRYGKINDGISCIAVTSVKHFEDTDYAWEWQTDDKTLRIGKPFN